MKKEIKIVNKERKVLQVTTSDERWYIREGLNKDTGLPEYEYVPSVTWICEHYPKGIAFYKWLANKGWDEAEALKVAAGDKGSKIHQAVGLLLDGQEIAINAAFLNHTTGEVEELSFEEYGAVLSFADWYKTCKPTIINKDFMVWGDGYAGMIDLLCQIDGQLYIVDFKTSQYIWPSHELQLSAYKHASESINSRIAILQLGYHLNKKKYKFTEIDDQYQEFMAAKLIWAKEQKNVSPSRLNIP